MLDLSVAPCSSLENSPDGALRLEDLPLDSWRRCLEQAGAVDILRAAVDRFGDGVAIVTSFQDSGTVLIDMAHRARLPLRVLTLDTGRLPAQSYEQIDRVRECYGVEVEIIFPDHREVEELVRPEGPNLFLQSREGRSACCEVRKIQPFRRAARSLDAWIAGVRRGHSEDRASIAKVEVDLSNRADGSLVKIHPLADWSTDRVWAYLRDHQVPYHPLYDQGYHSIGCAPCTRPSRPGEPARAARWWWEGDAKECGLHLVGESRHAPLVRLEGSKRPLPGAGPESGGQA